MDNLYYNIEKKLDETIKRLLRTKDIIKTIDNKYTNKLIHISKNGELNFNDIFNNELKKEDNNPDGLWLSCGSNWIKWCMIKSDNYVYNEEFLTSEYIYEIEINDKNILYINNVIDLVTFHMEFSVQIKDIGYDINWDKVKEKYDGVIICPHLAYIIWEKINTINDNNINDINKIRDETYFSIYNSYGETNEIDNYHINPMVKKGFKDILKEHIIKYPKFYLNWYTKWDTFTGVLWNKKNIKKIKKLKLKIIKK
jgi:hypothetical protein